VGAVPFSCWVCLSLSRFVDRQWRSFSYSQVFRWCPSLSPETPGSPQGGCFSASPVFPGRVSFGLPYCFPLIKRRSDATSSPSSDTIRILRPFLSQFFFFCYQPTLFSFSLPLACRTHQPPLHFPASRAARLFYASNCGRTGSETRSFGSYGVVCARAMS